MSTTELKIPFSSERLDALRFFMEKKEQTVEQELKEYLDKTYEKVVPAQVREYVERQGDQTHGQEEEQAPTARERPARQSRRQREQTSSEVINAQEVQIEAEGPAEEETQGMTMSM